MSCGNSPVLVQQRLPLCAPARVLACGAWLKNTACLLDGDTVWWSQVHGDLAGPDNRAALLASVETLQNQSSGPIEAVAHDLHPDFFSSQVAQQLADRLNVPGIAVQHHHAHISSVLAEHGVDAPALGLALDGVGLGSDGVSWGGEVLWVHGAEFERMGHLRPLALPGGDAAAREPWRMAAAVLHACGHGELILSRLGPVVGESAARTIQTMLVRDLNCPSTTAAGRWFDAAAGLLGFSVCQDVEAQAAMALEQAAARHLSAGSAVHGKAFATEADEPLWCVSEDGQIDLRPLFVSWIERGVLAAPAVDEAAARFHFALADALASYAVQVARQRRVSHVVLGGGCFFNRIIRTRIVSRLEAAGLCALEAISASCGDAGLALGQAWVAACRLKNPRGVYIQSEQISCA